MRKSIISGKRTAVGELWATLAVNRFRSCNSASRRIPCFERTTSVMNGEVWDRRPKRPIPTYAHCYAVLRRLPQLLFLNKKRIALCFLTYCRGDLFWCFDGDK